MNPRITGVRQLSEAAIAKQVKSYLEAQGWYAIRLQSGTVRGVTRGSFIRLNPAGTPDWIFVRKWGIYPIHLFVEIKTDKGKLRPKQIEWAKMADRNGFWHITAHSLNHFVNAFEKGPAR